MVNKMKENMKRKISVLSIMAFISTTAFCLDMTKYNAEETHLLKKLIQMLPEGNDLKWLFILGAMFLFFYYGFENIRTEKKTARVLQLVSGVFSIFTYIGIMCENYEDWKIGKFLFVISLLLLVGYFFVIYSANKILFYLVFEKKMFTKKETKSKWCEFLLEKHVVLSTILITAICWLPFMIYFYPGIANWDGMRSLTYWFGKTEWSNHHPVFISVLMGICMEIGQALYNDNMGIFVYSLLQTIVLFLTFANIQVFLKKIEAPYWLRGITMVYFAIMPFWQAVGYSLLKDPLYCMMLTNLTIIVTYMVLDLEKYSNSKVMWLAMLGLTLGCCFTRNNGVYVIFVLVVVVFLWVRKKATQRMGKIKAVAPFAAGIIIFYGCSNFLYPMLNIGSDGMQESLSLMFQQSARYVSEYENELTGEEKEILATTFQGGVEIGQVYNPELSDPVKNKLNHELSTSQLKDYLFMWVKQFFKHPSVYFEAMFYHTGAYYGTDYTGELEGIGANYNMITLEGVNPDNYLNVYFQEEFESQRFDMKKWAYVIQSIPGIGLIYSPASYQWICILCLVAVILYRKKDYCIIFIPSIITMLVALMSPVNGSLRYYMPVMAITPILLGIIFMKQDNTVEGAE